MNQSKKRQLKELFQIHFGFSQFRLGQEKAIDSILSGQDTLVIMPTGGGKSVVYQLPSLVSDGVTLVVSPLIALMKDQVDFLNSVGIPATFINSSLTPEETDRRIKDVRANAYKLLYIAPERFNNQGFIEHLKGVSVDLFAIDEAHCISEWGHDFRPSYTRLHKAIELVNNPPVVALTATATPEVKEDIVKQLRLKNPEIIVTGFARPNLQFGVIQTSEAQKASLIIDSIKYLPSPKGIVYTGTRSKADEITQFLLEEDIKAVSYHAGMDGEDRKWVQERFMKNQVEVVVATNAFGLGIDKKDIRFVVHHDMPGTVEAYYQEAGRAGRDGQPSFCLLLHSPKDRNLRDFFIRGDNPSPNTIVEVFEILLSHQKDKVLFTYNDIIKFLSESVPEMAVGTSLRILEKEGLLLRIQEKNSSAYLKLKAPDWDKAFEQVGFRSRVQRKVLKKLREKYSDKLEGGWQFNPEELAEIIDIKRESLKRAVRSLAEKEVLEYYPPFKGTEVKILKRAAPEELDIDFTELKKKAKEAYKKLDKLEEYIYSSGCRQKFILDYFGSLNPSPCERCDNCLNGPGPKEGATRVEPKRAENKSKLKTKLTQLETWELYKSGLGFKEISKQRSLNQETVVAHICFLLKKGLISGQDLYKWVSSSKEEKIIKAGKEVGFYKLKPIKEELTEDISYQDIKLVLAKNKKYG